MRAMLDRLWKLVGGTENQPCDIRTYHARRYVQELALQRNAKTPEARQAHYALALAHLELMDAKRTNDPAD